MRFSVLLVESEPIVLQTINDMLQVGGHFVKTSPRLDEALRWLDKVFVDVLVVSLDRSFSSASAVLAAKAKNPSMRIIGISTNCEQVPREAMTALDAYLLKPFSLDALQGSLRWGAQGQPTSVGKAQDYLHG
jgi:DNA-binding NtrC family response regulator